MAIISFLYPISGGFLFSLKNLENKPIELGQSTGLVLAKRAGQAKVK